MEKFLSLPYELQIILMAGYAGYKTTVIGRSVTHRTEDFLLQVILFGILGRSAFQLFAVIGFSLPGSDGAWFTKEAYALPISAAGALLCSLVLAGLWRVKLSSWWSWIMGATGVYRDDHEFSTWSSLCAAKATWIYVQIHVDDGRIYEADFSQIPKEVPAASITLNDDGIATYVTKVYREDGEEEAFSIGSAQGWGIEYFPRSTIRRLTIVWKN